MTRVAVLFGGASPEHEVSVLSARSVLAAIDRGRYEVVPIAITRSGTWVLPSVDLDQLMAAGPSLIEITDEAGRPVIVERGGEVAAKGGRFSGRPPGPVDVVFPVLHGTGGEDGTIQGLLESLGIPYVGAGVAASVLGMDKSLQKPIFERAGIPIAPWIDVREHEFSRDTDHAVHAIADFIGMPCFVKPAAQGSSVGVSKASSPGGLTLSLKAAFDHGDVAIVERAIVGRELEVGVLGNRDPQASVVGEVIPINEFYDYEAKYVKEGSRTVVPADVPADVADQIRSFALQAFEAIGCRGMARVDFFLSTDGEILLNEINTIPGFTPISMYPKLWDASGVGYADLISRLIDLALEQR